MPGTLLEVGAVSDHRGVATKVRNRITVNRRYITQLLDRARSCQPLVTDPMEEAVRSCGQVLALSRLPAA
jgi:hypothetical protein